MSPVISSQVSPGCDKPVPMSMENVISGCERWDLNPRPSGYEPDELPDCSTPRDSHCGRSIPTSRWDLNQSRVYLAVAARADTDTFRKLVTESRGRIAIPPSVSDRKILLLLIAVMGVETCWLRISTDAATSHAELRNKTFVRCSRLAPVRRHQKFVCRSSFRIGCVSVPHVLTMV